MRAFIVRPLGQKEGIDFDVVEADLIAPALDELEIGGRTTIDILAHGSIRTDMFHLLLTADLVIADLSIQNANVFYELGIRHALCDRHTFLIKSSGDEVPLDLEADRYFRYERDDPGSSLEQLTAALRRTLDSEAPDSPVFELIPDLEAQDRARLVRVPADFREEVELARCDRKRGDLALLAEEVQRFGLEWAEAGLRLVGEAQFKIRDFDGAGRTWGLIRRRYQSDDPQANQRPPARVLIFTGHRIDAPERAQPRFPSQAERKARAMIRSAVEAELTGVEGEVIGYAGGASGGDILFHEVCDELEIGTWLLLAGPRDDYVKASVQDAGPDWVRRFDQLHRRLESQTRVLSQTLELPRWLRSAADYSIWQRNNLWQLETALAYGSAATTLIALWNHEAGDGPGGTEDMVRIAKECGATTVILDARELL